MCPSSSDPERNGGPVPDYQYSTAFGNTASRTMSSTDNTQFGAYRYGVSILGTSTPMAAVRNPASVVMVVEGSGSRSQYMTAGNPRFWQTYTASEPQNFRPHLEGSNAVYGDGHVKWVSTASMRAAIGFVDQAAACSPINNLSATAKTWPYCSPLWNPFLP